MIKTFRGLMADEDIDQISLHTNDGATGYRIVKFQIMARDPGANTVEAVMKIYKIPQTGTPDGVVNFSDNTLMGVATLKEHDNQTAPLSIDVIFDKEIVNQDIFITYKDVSNGVPCNYYIELEQVKLDTNANTVATLKDMRNTATPLP